MNESNKYHPPRIAKWLLRCVLLKLNRQSTVGDFEEIYNSLIIERGKLYAMYWYWFQTVKSIPSIIINSLEWGTVMFSSYFKITWRNLLKQRMYSLITISGLAIGLGVFLFFFRFYLWADAADSFHKDIDRIYNVVQVFDSGSEGDSHTAYIPCPLAPAIKNDIPEIEDFTRFYDPGTPIISYGGKKFFENQVIFVDPNYFSFFTFKIIEGNPVTFFSNPYSVVISELIAQKYFGDEDAIGKILNIENKLDVVVTGVFQDMDEYPSSSSLYGQFIIPLETAKSLYGPQDDWKENNTTGFVKIKEGVDFHQVESKLELSRKKYYSTSIDSPKKFYLFPTKGIQYEALHIRKFAGYTSFIAYTLFLTLGFLFLLIVIFNYINLSTARYTERLKEVGVRKVIGANRAQLFRQFIGESIMITLIAVPFAIATYNFVGSTFCARVGFTFNISLWANSSIIIAFIITIIGAGIITGIYPAFFLSSFRPIHILKGKIIKGKSRGWMRKFLVVFQFSVSIILIVLSLVWQKQTKFLYNADLGYNRSGIIVAPISGDAKTNLPLMLDKLKTYPEIVYVTASTGLPGNWRSTENVVPEGMDESNSITPYVYGIDYNFLESIDVPFTLGRSFSRDYGDENKIVINNLFVEQMKWDNPIGKTVKLGDNTFSIVGVVKDFYFTNTFFPLAPCIFYIEQDNLNYIVVKTTPQNMGTVTEYIHSTWNEFSPNVPFEAFTLDDYFKLRNDGSTALISELFTILGIITIFFSSLGLLALSSYSVRQRTKEIGIRKVLGASITEVLRLLAAAFLKLVLIANIIALPIAYLFSKNLLGYAFSIIVPLGADIFIITVSLTLVISVIAIITQTYSAAAANPVKSLKYE